MKAHVALFLAVSLLTPYSARAQKMKDAEPVTYPPALPDGKEFASDTSEEFLKPPGTLLPEVEIAKTAPTVDFLFYPGQTYPGNPWSNWGVSLALNGKYYASIGESGIPARLP